MTDNLLFFNSDGYAYNFEYYTSTKGENFYRGDLYFDENSSDLYKTIALYIFEKVDPIKFNANLTMDEFSIFNDSGITFRSSTENNVLITNIDRVNSVNNFYSKWIYGDNFDTRFPRGTYISFSDVVFSGGTIVQNQILNSSFTSKHYQVIDNKPNAILINNNISNYLFTGGTFVTGGTISTKNVIISNDYTDGTWSQSKLLEFKNYLFAKSINTGETYSIKANIVGTSNNDQITNIVSVSTAQTYYKNFKLSGGSNDELELEFELYTKRPIVYSGPTKFVISGTTATITLMRQPNSLINFNEEQTIIFERFNGSPVFANNPIFTINDGILEDDVFNGEISFYEIENENYHQ